MIESITQPDEYDAAVTSAPQHEPVDPAPGTRSRAALLDAGLTEFAQHGYAGARVAAIAARAGVNKQLISYHFGGKLGLYRALSEQWRARERAWRAESPTLEDLVARYLEAALADPRGARLLARQTLEQQLEDLPGTDVRANAEELADLHDRQRSGELAADLAPGAVLLAVMGMVSAPLLVPDAEDLLGGDPDGYADQLRRIVRRLRLPDPGPATPG